MLTKQVQNPGSMQLVTDNASMNAHLKLWLLGEGVGETGTH